MAAGAGAVAVDDRVDDDEDDEHDERRREVAEERAQEERDPCRRDDRDTEEHQDEVERVEDPADASRAPSRRRSRGHSAMSTLSSIRSGALDTIDGSNSVSSRRRSARGVACEWRTRRWTVPRTN